VVLPAFLPPLPLPWQWGLSEETEAVHHCDNLPLRCSLSSLLLLAPPPVQRQQIQQLNAQFAALPAPQNAVRIVEPEVPPEEEDEQPTTGPRFGKGPLRASLLLDA